VVSIIDRHAESNGHFEASDKFGEFGAQELDGKRVD